MYSTIISQQDAQQLIIGPTDNLAVVDCRFSLAEPEWGRREYVKGHLPGALYAHLNHDLSGTVIPGVTGRHPLPDPQRFNDWICSIGISENTQVIAYDQGGGGIAARLWWLLRWIGHDAVAVLDGGWAGWVKAGLPVDRSVPQTKIATHEVRTNAQLAVMAEAVRSWCHDQKHVIVDSREERRYAGEEEPIDPVAGHIPAAVNLPFAYNLRNDGKWKDPEELRKRFETLLENRSCSEVVFYCGSGVTACHNVLAFKHAGLGDARLYPGSWSEWITQPERGVEVSD